MVWPLVPAQRAKLGVCCYCGPIVVCYICWGSDGGSIAGDSVPWSQWTCRVQWNDKGSWAYAMLQVLQGPPQFFTCLGDYITWQCTVKIGRYTIKSIQLLSSYQQKDVSWAEVGESESRWLLDLEDFMHWLVFTCRWCFKPRCLAWSSMV